MGPVEVAVLVVATQGGPVATQRPPLPGAVASFRSTASYRWYRSVKRLVCDGSTLELVVVVAVVFSAGQLM